MVRPAKMAQRPRAPGCKAALPAGACCERQPAGNDSPGDQQQQVAQQAQLALLPPLQQGSRHTKSGGAQRAPARAAHGQPGVLLRPLPAAAAHMRDPLDHHAEGPGRSRGTSANPDVGLQAQGGGGRRGCSAPAAGMPHASRQHGRCRGRVPAYPPILPLVCNLVILPGKQRKEVGGEPGNCGGRGKRQRISDHAGDKVEPPLPALSPSTQLRTREDGEEAEEEPAQGEGAEAGDALGAGRALGHGVIGLCRVQGTRGHACSHTHCTLAGGFLGMQHSHARGARFRQWGPGTTTQTGPAPRTPGQKRPSRGLCTCRRGRQGGLQQAAKAGSRDARPCAAHTARRRTS